jgi:hypothetical protein
MEAFGPPRQDCIKYRTEILVITVLTFFILFKIIHTSIPNIPKLFAWCRVTMIQLMSLRLEARS